MINPKKFKPKIILIKRKRLSVTSSWWSVLKCTFNQRHYFCKRVLVVICYHQYIISYHIITCLYLHPIVGNRLHSCCFSQIDEHKFTVWKIQFYGDFDNSSSSNQWRKLTHCILLRILANWFVNRNFLNVF